MPLGIVVAMPDEAGTLVSLPAADIRVNLTGPGPARAAAGARALIASGARALLSWGTSGALNPALLPGQLLVLDSTTREQGPELASDPAGTTFLLELLRPLTPLRSRALTVDHPVAEASGKATLARQTNCAAVDMESAAVAAVAREAGLPFLGVRAVLDATSCVLPRAALVGMDENGRARPGRVLLQLLREPSSLPALLRLARDYRKALHSLRLASQALAPALAGATSPRA